MRIDFRRTLHVLIVENSDVDRKMLMGMLSQDTYGTFKVDTVSTLKDAVDYLSQYSFDVVLLDLNIDDSEGIATLEGLSKEYPGVAIVVNTGSFQDDLGLRAVTMGAQDYLIKGSYTTYGLAKSLYYAIERKRAEVELQQALKNLQETQGHLIRVEKMNIVGSISTGIAHEVKNPLATILYGIEYLNTALKERNDKIDLTLRSMKEATHKANNIVRDLLDFASQSELFIAEHQIEDVVNHALNLTHHQCEKDGIQVVKEFSAQTSPVWIDKNRIEQVIVDVVLNAILAMQRDGVLRIATHMKKFQFADIHQKCDDHDVIAQGEDVVIVDFDDNGAGIRAEDMPHIFDPFFTTRRARGGVGLGLSIARTIMLNHKGLIGLSNLPGGGARARLVFQTVRRTDGEKKNSYH